MSTVKETKAIQGYAEKGRTCSNCACFESVVTQQPSQYGGTWTKESGKRCSIGNFAVKKTATCRLWQAKP